MIGGALGSRRELLTQDECVARNPARLVVALTVMLRLTGLVVDLFCGVATATAPGPPPCFYKRGFLLSPENAVCAAAMPTTGISWMTGSGLTTTRGGLGALECVECTVVNSFKLRHRARPKPFGYGLAALRVGSAKPGVARQHSGMPSIGDGAQLLR